MIHLVLLPGLLCNAKLWKAQIAYFQKKVQIVVPDLTKATSMENLAKECLATLPDSFSLVGFSMGGYLAFEMIRQAPQRITKLALLNTTHLLDAPQQRQKRLDFLTLAEKGKFRGITPHLIPTLLDPAHIHDHDIRTTLFEMARDIGKDGFIAQEKAILTRQDASNLLPQITIPTLIIGGQSDQITPPHHQTEMHRSIKGSRLYLLEHTGHVSPLESPNQVNQLIDIWLHW